MPYTLRQLQYFIAAGETSSITLASELVNISQPSISTAVAHLERELGVQLFIRHHAQGLALTPIGRAVLQEAKEIVRKADGLYSFASEASDLVRGQVSVGCLVTLTPMLMPELSHSFNAAFPAARVRQVENNHEGLLEGLRDSKLDIAITYDLLIPESIDFTPLARLPPHVLLGEGHRFARRSALSLQDVADEPLVLLDLPISREYFLGLFARESLRPTIYSRSSSMELVRTMVANGFGYSLLNARPRSDRALDGRRLVRVRLLGDHRPMTIGLASLASLRKSRIVEAFQAHCRAVVSDGYIPGMVVPSQDGAG